MPSYHVTVHESQKEERPFIVFEMKVEDQSGAVFVTVAVLKRVREVALRRGDDSYGHAVLLREDNEAFVIEHRQEVDGE